MDGFDAPRHKSDGGYLISEMELYRRSTASDWLKAQVPPVVSRPTGSEFWTADRLKMRRPELLRLLRSAHYYVKEDRNDTVVQPNRHTSYPHVEIFYSKSGQINQISFSVYDSEVDPNHPTKPRE